MKILKVLTNQFFWLFLIILLGFLVRLYKIDAPIADWHSWRQADTAAVTRNFINLGFNPLFPRYDDMTGVSENPIANPLGFRFVEFPIYNLAVYPFYLIFGVADQYHRLVSVLFSLGSILFIFLITKRYIGVFTSLISALTFALLPFNVFFSRTTLPESTFIFFALGMVYFLDRWIYERKKLLGVLGFIFTAVAFLTKPWAIFFFLPLLYSVYKSGSTKKTWLKFIIFTFFALLPFVLWRLWILQAPEGIPASNWLLNGDGIRFRPAFFWWIVSERLGREILGVTGLALFVLGFISRPKEGNLFLHFWALSAFLFIISFATGNVRHNYYQIQIVPIASIFMSLGFVNLLKGNKEFLPRYWTISLAFILYFFAFLFTFKVVKEFYKINNPDMVEAGRLANKILPKNAVVLAPYNGDSAFLYQTGRPGWTVSALPLKELISDYGVTAYVSTSRDDKTNWVLRYFNALVDNSKFVIVDLTTLKSPLIVADPEP